MFQKVSGIEKLYAEEGNITIFWKIFCLTAPKNFLGEPFFVSQNFWCRKGLWIRGGREYHDFQSKFFCLTLPKTFIGEPFSVSLFLGIEKFFASEGYVTIFCRELFVPHCRKIS